MYYGISETTTERKGYQMGKVVTVVLLFVMAACTSCNQQPESISQSNSLTRQQAMNMIEQNVEFQRPDFEHLRIPAVYPLSSLKCEMPTEIQLGEKEGYWTIGTTAPGYRNDGITLTAKATPFLTMDPICVRVDNFNGVWEFPMSLRKHITQVTGITGDDQNKTVEFLWMKDLNGLPSDLRQLFPVQAQKVFRATANMKHFDDGWRVTEVNTPPQFRS
jgi:hypothetical protein